MPSSRNRGHKRLYLLSFILFFIFHCASLIQNTSPASTALLYRIITRNRPRALWLFEKERSFLPIAVKSNFTWLLSSSQPVKFTLAPIPILDVGSSLNFTDSCSGEGVETVGAFLYSCVYYLRVDYLVAFLKSVSTFFIDEGFKCLLNTGPHSSILSMDIFFVGARRFLETIKLHANPPPCCCHRTYAQEP